jgi:hypothetical protein
VDRLDPSGLFTTKNRKKPPTNRNSIQCDGQGGITLSLPPIKPDTPDCLADCARRHEQSHKEDANLSSPGVCLNVPAGIVVEYSSPKERRTSERKACDIQIECLKNWPTCKTGPCNQATIQNSIEIVKAYCAQVTQ